MIMTIYRKNAMVLSIVIGIIAFILFWKLTPYSNTIGSDHPNENDFNKYKEYSLIVAKTLDDEIKDKDEDVIAMHDVTTDAIIVKIISHTYGYVFESVYPISNFTVDPYTLEIKGDIDYENVKHEFCYNDNLGIHNKTIQNIEFICSTVIIGAITGFLFYFLFFFFEELKDLKGAEDPKKIKKNSKKKSNK